MATTTDSTTTSGELSVSLEGEAIYLYFEVDETGYKITLSPDEALDLSIALMGAAAGGRSE